jgi:ankyrin repeat protein
MANDFFTAIQNGDQPAVLRLLDQDPALVNARNEQGLSAILVASYYGEPAIAALLIERGAHLNIFEAATTGDLPVLKSWVESDVHQVNLLGSDGFHPLGLAAFFGHLEAVAYLLSQGAQVNLPSNNAQHVTALISASAHRHLEIARVLIDYGADVNARQIHNFTALHNAAQNGQIELAELLLAHGAEINAASEDGRTPLAFARQQNQTAMIAFLEAHGGTA